MYFSFIAFECTALDALCSMSMSASATSSPSNIYIKDKPPKPSSLLFQSTSGLTVASTTATSTTTPTTITTTTTTSHGKTPKVFTFNVPPRTRLEEQRSARLERRIAEVQGLGQGQGGATSGGASGGGRGHVRSGQGQRTPTQINRQTQGQGLGGVTTANTPTSSNRHHPLPLRDDAVGYATVAVDGTPTHTTSTTTHATLATAKLFSQTTPLKGALESSLAREDKDNRMGRNAHGPGLGAGMESHSGVSGISVSSPATVGKSTSGTATTTTSTSSTKQTNNRKIDSKYKSQAFSSSSVSATTTTTTTPANSSSTRVKVSGGVDVDEINAIGDMIITSKENLPLHHVTADHQPPPPQQQPLLMQPPQQSPPIIIHNETTIISSREQNDSSTHHVEMLSTPISRIPSSDSTGDNINDRGRVHHNDPALIDNLQDSLSLSVATDLSTPMLPHGPIISPIHTTASMQGSGLAPLNHVTGRYSNDVIQTDVIDVDVPGLTNTSIKDKHVIPTSTSSHDMNHTTTQEKNTDHGNKSNLKINIGTESRSSTKGADGSSASTVHVSGGVDVVAGGGSPKRHSPKPLKRPPSGSAAVEYERNINSGGGGRGNNQQQPVNNRRNGNNPGMNMQHRQHTNSHKNLGSSKGSSTLVRPLSTPGQGIDGGANGVSGVGGGGAGTGSIHDHGERNHTTPSRPEGLILLSGGIVSTGDRTSPGDERVTSHVSSNNDITDQPHPSHQLQKIRQPGPGSGQGQGLLPRTTPLSARSNRSASPALSELSQGTSTSIVRHSTSFTH